MNNLYFNSWNHSHLRDTIVCTVLVTPENAISISQHFNGLQAVFTLEIREGRTSKGQKITREWALYSLFPSRSKTVVRSVSYKNHAVITGLITRRFPVLLFHNPYPIPRPEVLFKPRLRKEHLHLLSLRILEFASVSRNQIYTLNHYHPGTFYYS